MLIAAASLEEVTASLINTKQTSSGAAGAGKRPPWWMGLTLDQQDELLDRMDPERYGPAEKPPMAVGRWNREKRRVLRARHRWIEEIRALRQPCKCDTCTRHQRLPFPKYYVVRGISYECWLELHAPDPELAEELAALRNDRARTGTAFIGRAHIDGR
jgi:hypothetical protein